MSLEEITNFIDDKIDKNNNKIVIKYYEMKVKHNLTDSDMQNILELISIRVMNLGYNVYRTDEKYI